MLFDVINGVRSLDVSRAGEFLRNQLPSTAAAAAAAAANQIQCQVTGALFLDVHQTRLQMAAPRVHMEAAIVGEAIGPCLHLTGADVSIDTMVSAVTHPILRHYNGPPQAAGQCQQGTASLHHWRYDG